MQVESLRHHVRLRSAWSPPEWLLKLALLMVSTIIGYFVIELLVILILGEQAKFARHVVEAPWGLRYNEPGIHYRHKSADGTWYFRINGQGMRAERDFSYAKPDGVKRVVSLGDSYTIGYEVHLEECFSSILERNLNAAGMPVEVLNAGVSGFSNAEQLLYLERELMKYDPDLVMLSFYRNDLADNVRSGLFKLEGGELVEWNDKYVPAGRLGNFLNRNRLFTFAVERSNLVTVAKREATHFVKSRMTTANQGQVSAEAAADDKDQQLRLAAAIFERMYALLRGRDIPLLLQSIPGRPDEEGVIYDAFPLQYFDVNRPGITYFSAAEVLRPHAGDRLLHWDSEQHHWTPLSHRLAGETLARLVVELRLLA